MFSAVHRHCTLGRMISWSIDPISVCAETHHLRRSAVIYRKHGSVELHCSISRVHPEKHKLLERRRILKSDTEIHIRTRHFNRHACLIGRICNIDLVQSCRHIGNNNHSLVTYNTFISTVKEHTGTDAVTCYCNCLKQIAPSLDLIFLITLKVYCHHVRLPENIMMEVESHTGTSSHFHNNSVSACSYFLPHHQNISPYCPDTDSGYILSSHASHMNLYTCTLSIGTVLCNRVYIKSCYSILIHRSKRRLIKHKCTASLSVHSDRSYQKKK